MMYTPAKVFAMEERKDVLIISPQTNLSEIEFEMIYKETVAVLDAIDASGIRHVILDFKKTDYFGSSALGFFVRLWKRARERGGKLILCYLSRHEVEILRTTQLDEVWTKCPTLEDALALVENRVLAAHR